MCHQMRFPIDILNSFHYYLRKVSLICCGDYFPPMTEHPLRSQGQWAEPMGISCQRNPLSYTGTEWLHSVWVCIKVVVHFETALASAAFQYLHTAGQACGLPNSGKKAESHRKLPSEGLSPRYCCSFFFGTVLCPCYAPIFWYGLRTVTMSAYHLANLLKTGKFVFGVRIC